MELSESAAFPFHLRIPEWTGNATILINGEKWEGNVEDRIARIARTWSDGDEVTLQMPMELTVSRWYEFSAAIERGPLVYSLKIGAEKRIKDRKDKYKIFEEVFPEDAWNFALHSDDIKNPRQAIEVKENNWDGSYPWNLENAPVELKMRGIRLPEWKLHHSAPVFPAWWGNRDDNFESEEITLVPYGCTTLRITEFPVYDLQ